MHTMPPIPDADHSAEAALSPTTGASEQGALLCEAGVEESIEGMLAALKQNALGGLLYCSAYGGYLADACRLLTSGADANWRGGDGRTPLMAATRQQNEEMVRLLLPFSDTRATDDEGATALMIAAARRAEACFRLLLPHSDARARDARGQTALMHLAAAESHYWRFCGQACLTIGHELLSVSDATARDCAGWTALDHLLFAECSRESRLRLSGEAREFAGMLARASFGSGEAPGDRLDDSPPDSRVARLFFALLDVKATVAADQLSERVDSATRKQALTRFSKAQLPHAYATEEAMALRAEIARCAADASAVGATEPSARKGILARALRAIRDRLAGLQCARRRPVAAPSNSAPFPPAMAVGSTPVAATSHERGAPTATLAAAQPSAPPTAPATRPTTKRL